MYEGMTHRGGREENSGKFSELFLLGRVNVNNPDYEKAIKKCSGKEKEDFWDCAIEVIKQYQPFDPLNPKKRFLKDIRKIFIEESGIKDEKKVKIFTTVGSVVDKGKKMDAFIQVEDENGRLERVSFDHTLADNADEITENLEADVLIPNIPDPEEFAQDYENTLRYLGKSSARAYLSRKTVH